MLFRRKIMEVIGMSDLQALYETLKVIRKGTEDDFELRASDDKKVWGVKLTGDSPNKPTFALYAGPDAQEYACDLADYDAEDADDEDAEDEEESDDDDDDGDDE